MSFRIVPLVKGSFPQIALYRPVLLIGRHPECDVRIDSPKISRRHCCVAIAYDRVLIRDLGSRNGVRVNGRLLEEATIRSGDELAIGPILFRLEDEAVVPAAVARPSGAPVALPRPAVEIKKGQWPGSVPAPSSHGDSDVDLVPLDDI
jgi:pSer/pThr/pTyr-binding forkhead associated (FHA) protein